MDAPRRRPAQGLALRGGDVDRRSSSTIRREPGLAQREARRAARAPPPPGCPNPPGALQGLRVAYPVQGEVLSRHPQVGRAAQAEHHAGGHRRLGRGGRHGGPGGQRARGAQGPQQHRQDGQHGPAPPSLHSHHLQAQWPSLPPQLRSHSPSPTCSALASASTATKLGWRVLWRKKNIPAQPPAAPPTRARPCSTISGTRSPPCRAGALVQAVEDEGGHAPGQQPAQVPAPAHGHRPAQGGEGRDAHRAGAEEGVGVPAQTPGGRAPGRAGGAAGHPFRIGSPRSLTSLTAWAAVAAPVQKRSLNTALRASRWASGYLPCTGSRTTNSWPSA